MGVPVVAMKSGGIPEMIEDGVTGILVDPNNSASFTKALDRLAGSAELRISIGKAASAFVRESLQSTVVIDRYQEIFQSVTQR